ncbi:MAG: hypothetical protein LBL26_04300, partial [Peptococcaceae bacterium]|nr:hypothetical protein [Peptococcaceae bacterium]
MNLWKSKKTVALILTLMMFFSNAAIAMAVPEKVQVGSVNGVVQQYGFDTVANNSGINRAAFIQALFDADPLSLILLDAGVWYDVEGITLEQAKQDSSKTNVPPAVTYVPILDNGTTTSQAVAELIDDVDSANLSDSAVVQSLLARYNALSAAEKAIFETQQAYRDLQNAAGVTPSDAPTPTPTPPPSEGDVTVTAVNSINGAVVRVVLANVTGGNMPAPGAFTVTDSLGGEYTVNTVGIGNTTENEYILTIDHAPEGVGILTVAINGSSANRGFDTTVEGLEFVMSTNATNNTLPADGRSVATVSLTVKRDGEVAEDFKGTVSFASDRLAQLSKGGVEAFDHGVASIQVTSLNSPLETITDTITATLVNTPDDTALQGNKYPLVLQYVPVAQGGTDDRIFMVSVTSDSASRVYVTFNNAYDPVKLTTALVRNVFRVSRDKDALPSGPNYLTPDGYRAVPNSEGKTIELQFRQSNALRDNTDITVQTLDRSNYIIPNSGLTFTLNDTSRPAILGVQVVDMGVLEIQFTEPIVTRDVFSTSPTVPVYAGAVGNWNLNTVNGRLTTADIELDGIAIGRRNDRGDVIPYTAGTAGGSPVDNRSYITIQLSSAGITRLLKPGGQENLIQASNVRDFAGLTDAANTATTQEFRFVTPEPPGPPAPTFAMDSPEQFRITFDQQLLDPLTIDNVKFEQQVGVTSTGAPNYVEIDVVATPESINQQVILTDASDPRRPNTTYLLELAADWTVVKDLFVEADGVYGNPGGGTITYFTPNNNRVRVTVSSVTANPIKNRYQVEMFPREYTDVRVLSQDARSPYVANEPVYDAENNLIRVAMNEPVQMNTSVKTLPLSPSGNQMKQSRVEYTTRTDPYIADVVLKYNAIPVPTFHFVNENGVDINGTVIAVAADDMSFDVRPAIPLESGHWQMTIESISDDIGNTIATEPVDILLEDEVIAPTEAVPYVVWADAVDNIYDLQDNKYVIGDIVSIQYSQLMSNDVLVSSNYTVNGNPLPTGLLITSETAYYDCEDCDPYPTTGIGTLVTIHLSYDSLGNVDQEFAPNNKNNPYKPMESNTLIINPKVTDNSGKTLEPRNNAFTLTYHIDGIRNTPHVTAYYNTFRDTQDLRNSYTYLASLERALLPSHTVSPTDDEFNYVRGVALITPFYDQWGRRIDNNATAFENEINDYFGRAAGIEFEGSGDFIFEVPADTTIGNNSSGNPTTLTINADNAVSVTVSENLTKNGGILEIEAGAAESVVVNAAVTGNGTLTVEAPEAKAVEINGDVTGDVIIDAKKADVLITGDITGDLIINGIKSNTLYISAGVKISTLTLNVGATVENAGHIDTLIVDLNETADIVTLRGAYARNAASVGSPTPVATVIRYFRQSRVDVGYIINKTNGALKIYLNTNVAAITPDLDKDATYPATGDTPQISALKTILPLFNTPLSVATSTSLTLANFNTAGVNMAAFENNGGTDAIAANAIRVASPTSLPASVSTPADATKVRNEIQTAISETVTALALINSALKSDSWGTPDFNAARQSEFLANLDKAGIFV